MTGPQLTVGDFGDEVAHLHENLVRGGFEVTAAEVERKFFGPATRDAVADCQRRNQVEVTGHVDKATAAVLSAAGGATSVVPAPPTDLARSIAVAPQPMTVTADPAPTAEVSACDRWDRVQVAPESVAATDSCIAALSKTATHQEIWWVAPNGSLQGAYRVEGASWTHYELAGPNNVAASAGIAAVSKFSTHMEVWWVAPTGSVQGAYWVEGAGWTHYELAGPNSAAGSAGIAAVSRTSTNMEVWWVAPNGSVQGAYWVEGAGWTLYELAGPNSAAPLTSIAALSRVPTAMEVWWVAPNGSVQGAWWVEGAPWLPYELAGPNSAATRTDIAAVSRIPTSMEVWWVGPDGSVLGAFWYDDGAPWQSYPVAVAGSASPSTGIATLSRIPTKMEVWWVGPDGAVQGAFWSDGGRWQSYPVAVAGSASQSTGIAAVSRIPTSMEVWWVGPDGAVRGAWWVESALEPAPVPPGRPLKYFAGTLPYASELFGVYQPLAGWFGMQNSLRAVREFADDASAYVSRDIFSGAAARVLDNEALGVLAARCEDIAQGVLSPVGVADLFRQYFFEFDTFLGPPAGHLWLSPGGTVEVVETSTRRMLVEKTVEQAEETSRKVEETLTEQDDVADAVKEENANDTNLGISATGGVNAGIYHADASASFNLNTTVKRSSEQTHKHTRTQSSKVTSEIKRNFKTTFKTVTETTDMSSRRYVVQNTTNQLVNYELRRKMRKVGVQLQHIGTRLSWQVYLDVPGRDLGLGELVHVVPAPDVSAIRKPEPLPSPEDKKIPFHFEVPFLHDAGPDDEAVLTYLPYPDNHCRGVNSTLAGDDDTIQLCFDGGSPQGQAFPLPPLPPGYALSRIDSIDHHGAQVQYTRDAADLLPNPDTAKNVLKLRLTYVNFQGRKSLPFDAVLVYTPTDALKQEIKNKNDDAQAAYDAEVAELERQAYGNAIRERLKLVSAMRPRPSQDLRKEERQVVYGSLIRQLRVPGEHHLISELIRQIFDVDEMLYFVAPEYWRPSPVPPPPPPDPLNPPPPHATKDSVGKYPVPLLPGTQPPGLAGQTVASWYSHTDQTNAIDPQGNATPEWRVNYLISEQTQPAPMGSSLGWLIQPDGDVRRNEFLNAAWAKAVLPVRPGQECAALTWLKCADIEGEAALDLPYPFQEGDDPDEYQGLKVGEVLDILASQLRTSNRKIANTLAAEKVFETGFDPLEGGFRPAAPYEIFDQWVEVLPTDQVVAVQVNYDPKTGQQL